MSPDLDVPDAALVDRAVAGDGAAAGVLLARHRDGVVALCRRLVADPFLAEDCAQDAALIALLSLHHLHDRAQFGPWLRGIGIRCCRRALRARAIEQRRTYIGSGDDVLAALPGGDDLAADGDPLALDDLSHTLRAAIADLPVGQRDAVHQFYLRGLPYHAAAVTLGIPTGALKVRLHKARAALRQHLDPTLGRSPTLVAAGVPRAVMAIHEAGHAMLHLLNGTPVSRVSITSTELAASVATRARAHPERLGIPAYDLLTATMAGEAAELEARTTRRYVPNRGDRPTAARIARTLTEGDPVETALVVDQARQAARERLAAPHIWRLVERVRAALLVHTDLDGDDFLHLVAR